MHTSCIEFTGSINKRTGYGSISRGKRCGIPAHRYYYEMAHGAIPKGMVILHKCDNRKCVNVNHLKAGTQSENMLDCVAKGRNHDQRGSKSHRAKLTDLDVTYIRSNLDKTNEVLGLMFNVSKRTISDIRTNKTWRHLNV